MSSNNPTATTAKFEREFDDWQKDMEASMEATRRSEILTAEDYAVTINATSDDVHTATTEASAVPERLFMGMCKRHGFCDPSHRCAVYDGEESLEYILRSAHQKEVERLQRGFQTERDAAQMYSDELFKTQAEAARLREALQKAVREGRHGPMCDRARCVCWKAAARTALNSTREGEE